MARIRLYILMLLWIPVFAGMTAAQETDKYEDSEVISGNVEASKQSVEYWTAEKENQTYCVPETKTICLNMEATCEKQITAWVREIENQVIIGESYVKHSPTYWAAKRYLGWAYKARDAVKELYSLTNNQILKYVLEGMNKAISAAEALIKLFE